MGSGEHGIGGSNDSMAETRKNGGLDADMGARGLWVDTKEDQTVESIIVGSKETGA